MRINNPQNIINNQKRQSEDNLQHIATYDFFTISPQIIVITYEYFDLIKYRIDTFVFNLTLTINSSFQRRKLSAALAFTTRTSVMVIWWFIEITFGIFTT